MLKCYQITENSQTTADNYHCKEGVNYNVVHAYYAYGHGSCGNYQAESQPGMGLDKIHIWAGAVSDLPVDIHIGCAAWSIQPAMAADFNYRPDLWERLPDSLKNKEVTILFQSRCLCFFPKAN